MPAVYFHIDDSDIRKIILENDYKEAKPKAEILEAIICEACHESNGSENIICWNCGHKLGTTDIGQINALTNILTSKSFKNILRRDYERLRDDHMIYEGLNNDKKKEYQELENDFQDLEELMDKIDNLKSK